MKKFLSARPQVDSTSHRVPTAHTNPTTRSENKEMLEEVPGQPQPRNLATASGHYRQLSIQAEEASIPDECVRLTTLQDIIRKAEFLMNEPNAIKEAASNDPRMRTVKSRNGGIPLIVHAVNSKSNLFSCQCSTYNGLGLCADTIAVAEEQGLLFEYLADLRTKLSRKKGKKNYQGDINITAAINTGLKLSEKGLKPGEAQKARRRTQKPRESHSANPSQLQQLTTAPPCVTSFTSQAQLTAVPPSTGRSSAFNSLSMLQGLYQMNHATIGEPPQPLNTDANFRTPQAQVSISTTPSPVPYQSLHQPITLQWHSGFSPYQYTLCELPPAVKKCYGCGEEFSQNYRMPPNNAIVKHVDRRLRGRDEKGQLVYSPDFTNTYYHPISSHIARKNPVFCGSVQVDRTFYERLTYGQQLEISSFDFNLNIV